MVVWLHGLISLSLLSCITWLSFWLLLRGTRRSWEICPGVELLVLGDPLIAETHNEVFLSNTTCFLRAKQLYVSYEKKRLHAFLRLCINESLVVCVVSLCPCVYNYGAQLPHVRLNIRTGSPIMQIFRGGKKMRNICMNLPRGFSTCVFLIALLYVRLYVWVKGKVSHVYTHDTHRKT